MGAILIGTQDPNKNILSKRKVSFLISPAFGASKNIIKNGAKNNVPLSAPLLQVTLIPRADLDRP